ncbi:MAG TPA: hypothetical protein VMF52_04515 [Steroidobacteraceae bacterium]|nr:hypothetical protein [Steroidobacteraceae bacterium]
MRTRRGKWTFILVALITNLGGGPMAWAHLASGHCHESMAPGAMPAAMDMPADCAEHGAASSREKSPTGSLPCCDGGTCACAAPPAPLSMPLLAPTDLRHDTFDASSPVARVAPDPLDDTLRPPIR